MIYRSAVSYNPILSQKATPCQFLPSMGFFPSCCQLFDLGSPVESFNTVPGCSLNDDDCANMKHLPTCGKRGHCERDTSGCLCQPGFTGLQCDQGKHLKLLLTDHDVFRESLNWTMFHILRARATKLHAPQTWERVLELRGPFCFRSVYDYY